MFKLCIMNQRFDINDAFTHGKYCEDVEFDQSSMSQGQRSRSCMQVFKKLNRLYIINQLLDIDCTYTYD